MKKIKLSCGGKSLLINYNEHFGNLILISQSLNNGAQDNYLKMGLVYVDVPEMVGITGACENVDTLFKVHNRMNIPLFFTQTGQLSLEQSLQSFPGAFTVIHSGRDEEEEDARHLRQFRLTEEEFDCTLADMTDNTYDEDKMFEALLQHIQSTIQAMIKQILKNNGDTLRKTYKRDISKLKQATRTNFLRIEYEDAVALLNKNGFPNVSFGDDLKAHHEAKIVALLNNGEEIPVFITKYPKEIKFFNMKVSTNNPKVVLSADLILPYAGEGIGSAVREHDFTRLNERLLTSNMYRLHIQRGGAYEDFAWYLDIIKSKKTNPHAGYGIGNERMLQYIFGENDIRNVSVFSLLNIQSRDWDTSKYGKASIVSAENKHLLLSLNPQDKKILLPYIKRLKEKKNFILFSTQKTHTFLMKHHIKTSLVYKISEIGKNPNIAELLAKRTFDLIINTPSQKNGKELKELTDGKLIRKGAKDMGITLITTAEDAIQILDNLSRQPFYDPEKTYEENYDYGPFISSIKSRDFIQKEKPKDIFLGHKVYVSFGIPAGPLLNSNYIKYAFDKGFDIAVYKTVRSLSYPCHPFPNILSVKINGELTLEQLKNEVQTDIVYRNRMSITNSFGVPSKEPYVWQADVKKALRYEKSGQLLILSFMGTAKKNQTQQEFIDDFVLVAKLSLETGAKVLEVNLSCPNIASEGLVCYNLPLVHKIIKKIRSVIHNTPLILKTGFFKNSKDLLEFTRITNEYANAISAINTLQANIVDKFNNQALPGKVRLASGICGDGIRWAGLDMVKRLRTFKDKHNFKYTIIGVGGVIMPEDYFRYKKAGADCVMSATGSMWNSYLAYEIKKELKLPVVRS